MPSDTCNANYERRVQALVAERGDKVGIGEVAEIVNSIMDTMKGDVSMVDLRVYKELDDLAKYIQKAKGEIADLYPGDLRDQHLPAATDHLDAIVANTEEATSTILDAAEVIGARAGELDAPEITEQVTRIFEASSFQDLTGQRISKVIATLKYIDERLDRLVSVFGAEVERSNRAKAGPDPSPADPDSALLNGPALPNESNKQEDIDALLASLG